MNPEPNFPQILSPEQLYRRCEPEQFSFATTDELPVVDEVVGQARATAAMRFGVRMRGGGYNLFVLGPPGSGRHGFVRRLLEQDAVSRRTPADWCYVHNFDDPQKPRGFELPAGRGNEFQRDMTQLVEDLKVAIPAAFDSDEYRTKLAEIEGEHESRRQEAMRELEGRARAEDIGLIQTPQGYALAPMKDGTVLKKSEFEDLSDREQAEAQERITRFTDQLSDVLEQFPRWEKENRRRVTELDQETTRTAASALIEDLQSDYADCKGVVDYLDTVRTDVIENAGDFRKSGESGSALPFFSESEPSFARYEVNLLVNHRETRGAPIVYESNPTYQNLVGRVEHVSKLGTLMTDFRMIRNGALHRANHGYLMLDADRLLMEPFAWQGLKRALFGNEIRIESLGQLMSLVSTVSLEPKPVPLHVKVVLLGERWLYYLLCQLDRDFGELFKVAADFEDRMDRNEGSAQLFARMIATLVRKHELRPLTRGAVARVIEQSSRHAEDAEKLSTYMRSLTDLLRESDYQAAESERDFVEAGDVQRALQNREDRLDRVRDRIQEEIQRDTILIATDGDEVGQINGLSVLQLGELSFGQPSRITATARLGEGEIIDIEREVKLGGAIHAKGILILSSFLGARYARSRPLSLSASLVFEQTYGAVEGDSASVAELVALLSAIAGVSIRQSMAVTGSINQLGRVQVIGGVNEKIEGFFDVCKARGLTGEQGVLIPQENVKHLMLRHDVVEAVREGRFHIYAIRTIDDALALLSGLPAGERDDSGDYPPGSFNRRVADSLQELAQLRREFSAKEPTAEAAPASSG